LYSVKGRFRAYGAAKLTGDVVLLGGCAEQVLMVLRDGRHLVGYLRSFDQYCTLQLLLGRLGLGHGAGIIDVEGGWLTGRVLLRIAAASVCYCRCCATANIILEDTYERHVAGGMFCDIELGLNIIRYAAALQSALERRQGLED